MTGGAETAAPGGLIGRIRASYWDFRGAAQRIIAERPSDAILLSFLMIALALQAFGGVIELFAAHEPDTSQSAAEQTQRLQTELMETLIGRVFIGALAVYLVAAILAPVCRAFGGHGGGYETRAAVIWGVLVSSPVIFLQSVVASLRRLAERGLPEETAVPFSWAGYLVETVLLALAFVIWAGSIAGAHGFRSQPRVLGAMLAFAAALGGLVWGIVQLL